MRQAYFPFFILLASAVSMHFPVNALPEVARQKESGDNIGEMGIIDFTSTWSLRHSSGWTPSNLTEDEGVILKALCRMAITANGGVWGSVRVNAAISVLSFGADPPDYLQSTVYKTCMMAGGMDQRDR